MATESTPPRYPKVPQAPGQELDTKQVLQGTQEARLLLTTQLRDATGEMFNLKKRQNQRQRDGAQDEEGRERYRTQPPLLSPNTTSATMKKGHSYLHPYLQRMEQPVRKRRNQKFSVSELDFTRLYGEKI